MKRVRDFNSIKEIARRFKGRVIVTTDCRPVAIDWMSQEDTDECFIDMNTSDEDIKSCFVTNLGCDFFDDENVNVTNCSDMVNSLLIAKELPLGYLLEAWLASLYMRLVCRSLSGLSSCLILKTQRLDVVDYLVHEAFESLSSRVQYVLLLCSLRDCGNTPTLLLVDTLSNCIVTRQQVEKDIAYAVDLKLVCRDYSAIVLKHDLCNVDYSGSVEVISMHPWVQSLLCQKLSQDFLVQIADNFSQALGEHLDINSGISVSLRASLTARGVTFCNLLLSNNCSHLLDEKSVAKVKQLIWCLENYSWPKRIDSNVTKRLKG